MKKHLFGGLLLSVLCVLSGRSSQPAGYTPDWKSLSAHTPVPEWLRDAKFGIYCHWGVYSVPAYGNEQYYHFMHCNDSVNDFLMGLHRRHEAIYGPLTEFGYHDFIPMFKAEHFNADEWARLFQESGARFAGLVAEHHDGFSMWDSDLTPFCAKKMGPGRDIVGELGDAIRKRGMKFFTSLHHEINYTYADIKPGWAGHDPKYSKLYGCLMPHDEWLGMWLGKCNEVVEKYSPDIIYFDAWMEQIPDSLKRQFAANYFNHAASRGQEVCFTYKYEDFPRTVGMLDHEMANPKEIDPIPWLCDYTISTGYHKAWGYVKGQEYCSHKEIIQKLVEVVSNNGQLLLSLAPMADGTFPQAQKDVVANVGVWLWSYGESIYETRPFAVSGETVDSGETVKYTRKPDSVYAIFLEWPGDDRELTLRELNDENLEGRKIGKATLLSVKKNYECTAAHTSGGVKIHIPKGARMPSDAASVIRFDLE